MLKDLMDFGLKNAKKAVDVVSDGVKVAVDVGAKAVSASADAAGNLTDAASDARFIPGLCRAVAAYSTAFGDAGFGRSMLNDVGIKTKDDLQKVKWLVRDEDMEACVQCLPPQ